MNRSYKHFDGKQTEPFLKNYTKIIGEKKQLRDIVDWPQAQPPGGYKT